MSTRSKLLLAASALGGALIAAASAQASTPTPVTILSSGIYQPGYVDVDGTREFSTAVDFSTLVGNSTTPKTLYGFCVDLTHNIYVGVNYGQDIRTANGNAQGGSVLAYQTAKLKYDSVGAPSGQGGVTLSTTQVKEIYGLAAYGRGLITGAGPAGITLSDNLAAIQGAIWAIEYPHDTVVAEDGTVASEMASYIANAGSYHGNSQAIYDIYGNNQGFVVGTQGGGSSGSLGNAGGVPEPATWGLMIVGAGLIGAAARRRRHSGILAAA